MALAQVCGMCGGHVELLRVGGGVCTGCGSSGRWCVGAVFWWIDLVSARRLCCHGLVQQGCGWKWSCAICWRGCWGGLVAGSVESVRFVSVVRSWRRRVVRLVRQFEYVVVSSSTVIVWAGGLYWI